MLERGLFDGLFFADVLAKSPTVIDGIRPRKSGSHQTHRWRKGDSNRRSRSRDCRLIGGEERGDRLFTADQRF
jgi:hypothetical protein